MEKTKRNRRTRNLIVAMVFGGNSANWPHPQIWRLHNIREMTDMLRKWCPEFYLSLLENHITPSSGTIWLTTYLNHYEKQYTISASNIREFRKYMELHKKLGREDTIKHIKAEKRDKKIKQLLE